MDPRVAMNEMPPMKRPKLDPKVMEEMKMRRLYEDNCKIDHYGKCLQDEAFKAHLQRSMTNLILLLHAERCLQWTCNTFKCPLLGICQRTKDLIIHMESCQATLSGQKCPVPECEVSKATLTHWGDCKRKMDCPWCAPAYQAGKNYSLLFY